MDGNMVRIDQPAQFAVVKTFSATMAKERNSLGERITEWLAEHPGLQVVDKVVTQSSDSEFHCLSVTLFLAVDE